MGCMSMIGHNGGPSMGNWVSISRDIESHPVVGFGQPVKPADPSRGSYSKAEAWMFLLFRAKWESAREVNRGRSMMIHRGELQAARSWLAKCWNWTEKTVRVFVDQLEAESMAKWLSTEDLRGRIVVPSSDKRGASEGPAKLNVNGVISICNYDIYQTVRELDRLLEGPARGQQKGQRGASEGPAKY